MNNTIFCVSMVKDEIDIFPYVIDHLMAEGVDAFYIADNMSTDGTRDYLSDMAKEYDNFYVIDDKEVGYYQQIKMQQWIEEAVKLGAGIILPVDADECWYAKDPNTTLSEALKNMPVDVAIGRVYDMIPRGFDVVFKNPMKTITFRESHYSTMPCVAYRWHPDAYIAPGNHDVGHPGTRSDDVIEIRHYQYRSFNQMRRKVRNGKNAYDHTDLPEGIGYHWRVQGSMDNDELLQRWNELINQPGLIYDPAPVKEQM